MGESASKKGTIDCAMPAAFRRVNILASRTKQLDRFLKRVIAQAYGQERLLIAEHTRTSTEISPLVLFQHLGQASCGDDITSMYQAVEEFSLCFYRITDRVGKIIFEGIGDEIECLWIVLNFCVETGEIETIEDVVFVDFAKVLVAFGGEEPGDPRVGGVIARCFRQIVHCGSAKGGHTVNIVAVARWRWEG